VSLARYVGGHCLMPSDHVMRPTCCVQIWSRFQEPLQRVLFVTRHCDTVQTPIVREHLLVHVSMKSVWSLGIKQFYPSTCVHLQYPQRAQTIPIIVLPLPYRITLGSEDGPQGGRGGSAWVQETFASLRERESRFEGNGGSTTLRSGAASN